MNLAQVKAGLERFLGEHWGDETRVRGLTPTSAGARRLNVLFDAEHADTIEHLVLTAIPNEHIAIQPIGHEAATIRCAERAGVAVAHVLFDSEDPGYVGGPFFISRRVDGETVPRRVLRLVERVGHGEMIAGQLGANFARLHAIDEADLPPHLVWDAGAHPGELALAALAGQIGELLQPSPVFNLGLRWLERCLPPAPARVALVHSDMRNGNLVINEQGLAAILDWEGSHRGDPMTDLAWPCLRTWRFGADHKEVGGLAGREALIRGYEAAGGRFDEQAFHWWKVLGTLRWGLGLAGQARAHIDGSVPNIVMAASGRRVVELEYDLLGLIKPR